MREIRLPGGRVTLVDDDDYERLTTRAWKVTSNYVCRTERRNKKDRHITMSRVIMNCPENMVVDHINGDTMDNRKCNLRVCTQKQNAFNRDKQKNNTSGYKGVTFNKWSKRWQSVITKNRVNYYLGLFDTPEEAYEAYKSKAKELHGEFAKVE